MLDIDKCQEKVEHRQPLDEQIVPLSVLSVPQVEPALGAELAISDSDMTDFLSCQPPRGGPKNW